MIERIRQMISWLPHDYAWVEHDGSSFKRRCTRCDRVEVLFQHRLPSTERPSLEWKFMYYAEKVEA